MALKWPDKDPDANKDYSLDWTAMLADGEVIETSAWAADPVTDLVIGLDSILDGVTTVWLSGGAEGATYKLVNTIETDRGLVDERTVSIKIKTQ